MNLIFPRRLERQSILSLLQDLDLSRNLAHVTIDFSQLRYSLPIAMLVAGSKLRDWWRYRDESGYQTDYQGVDRNVPAHSYLMHLGFFDFVYMPHGIQVGHARGSSRYLPITRITRPLVNVHEAGLDKWYAKIEAMARRLAAVLTASFDDSQELRAYTYSIREIIRNVFEHSGADECFICGQRWYDGSVEIALIDEGVGIGTTLREANEVKNDGAALLLSIRPGISRTGQNSTATNLYDNSGFGLFILTELAASFGWFVLGSGGAQLIGQDRRRDIQSSSFSGTYFGIRLRTSPRDFGSVLADIIEAGEAEARVSGINARASGRTRLIGSSVEF
jgi:anti-sigma regulatory factor (Ser/Thr protein kinase)